MGRHVIVGAGAVGSEIAELLTDRGEQVVMVSRRGTGPNHPSVERIAADANDAERLTGIARGADVLYNCLNPEYHRWLTDWPPLHAALLVAAERSGAVLASVNNLYPHGPVTTAMTQDTPDAATHPKLRLRGQMWHDEVELHRQGRIRATEVRGSDYIEANSIFTFGLAKPLLAGRRAMVPGALDVPHTWTSIQDVARSLITVAADERGHGRSWPVPSNPALTVRQIATRFCRVHGAPDPKLSPIPYPVFWAAGLFSPMVKELRTTRYQFVQPFVLDSSVTERTFDLTPIELDAALKSVRVP